METSFNVAAYCRVSTDADDQLHSLQSQRHYFCEYINAQPAWNLADIYYDEGVSGTSLARRTGFLRMLSEIEEKQIRLILTKEVSRFARNTVDTLQTVRQLKERGVGVLFLSDGIDTRSDGEFRLTLMAGIAQEESRKTSERVKWGQQRSMEQGVVFGRSMLGYTVKNGQMQLEPSGAALVKRIYALFLQGNSCAKIARILNTEQIPSMRSALWSGQVVSKILRNEKYTGVLVQHKTFTPDFLTHLHRVNRGELTQLRFHDHHPAIISRTDWETVQKMLNQRKK